MAKMNSLLMIFILFSRNKKKPVSDAEDGLGKIP